MSLDQAVRRGTDLPRARVDRFPPATPTNTSAGGAISADMAPEVRPFWKSRRARPSGASERRDGSCAGHAWDTRGPRELEQRCRLSLDRDRCFPRSKIDLWTVVDGAGPGWNHPEPTWRPVGKLAKRDALGAFGMTNVLGSRGTGEGSGEMSGSEPVDPVSHFVSPAASFGSQSVSRGVGRGRTQMAEFWA